ncbi:MAG: Clp protease N-terminal domain-containing protein [Hyphomicrobiaceae bacterium]|nr:Clp protease N-terminal domain-containing protein [Hyphomicrobiaceae bacterium]
MGYRGEDLDLRTPQTWSQGADRHAMDPSTRSLGEGFPPSGERAPIFVDETLLASCNHAYDVALAHRAAEVRIEHLLYALTRIDAAAEILEAYGIRDASLRRDSATVIASEIPIGLTNGAGKPRRSMALEEALRLASDHARRRNATAGVADLLTVFLDLDPGLQGLELLRRHMAARPEYRAVVVPPPAYDPPAEPAYEPLPSRPRRPARASYAADLYADARDEPRRPIGRPDTQIDSLQNVRLDQLERMVRELRQDLADERSTFSAILQSLQRDLSANREDHGRMSEGLTDRLSAFERTLLHARDSGGDTHAENAARGIEMERRLAQRLDLITTRLEQMEHATVEDRSAVSRSLASLAERMRSLEGAVTQTEAGLDLTPIEGRLSDIETAVLSLEGGAGADALGRQLESIETSVATRMAALTELMGSRLAALDQSRAEDRTASAQHLAAVSETVSRQQVDGLAQIAARVGALVSEHLTPVVQAIGEVRAFGAATAARLDAMDASLLRQAQETAEARETYGRELSEVHEAIVKLNTNQHTLAGAIDRWRSDQVADMNTISKHLAQLDSDNDAPIARLDMLSERMDGMYRATVERYHRRNRFWFWVFGTDDWLGSSWPSQTAKVEEELRAIRSRQTKSAASDPPA